MSNILDLFIFKYNRTDFHELNLDWIISDLRTLAETLENFVSLNVIKYADPIQWNITTQYETNTVVIDANDGTAYLSVKPVPSGVALSNTDYWTPIFTLNLLSANQNITLRDDSSNVLATFASDTGDWLIWNSTLYKVRQPININEAYVVGYNLDRYSVELFINDYITAIVDKLGDLDDLSTTDKSTIVNAINELVSALSTVSDSVSNRQNYITPKMMGAVGDGVTDDTDAIQDAIDYAVTNRVVCLFDTLTYAISAPISITSPVFVEGQQAKIIPLNTMTCLVDINIPDPIASYGRGEFNDFLLDCDFKAQCAIYVEHNINSIILNDIQINNPTLYGIHGISAVRANNIVMRNNSDSYLNLIGLFLEGADNFIDTYMAINFQKSLVSSGNGNMFRCNSWNSFPGLMKTSVFAELSAWWTFDECVIDTWALGVTGPNIRLSNCTFFWSAGYYTDASVGDSTTLPVLFDSQVKYLNNVRVFPPAGRTDQHSLFTATQLSTYRYNVNYKNMLTSVNNMPLAIEGFSFTKTNSGMFTLTKDYAKRYQTSEGMKHKIHQEGTVAYALTGNTPVITISDTSARPSYIVTGLAVIGRKLYPVTWDSDNNRFIIRNTESIAVNTDVVIDIEYYTELG